MRKGETLVVDVNKSWTTHETLRILKKTEDVDFYIEQPCRTYEECLAIRPKVRQPMILDECMEDIGVLLRALTDNLFEGIGCKVSRVGGITGMRLIRDVCKASGKILTCDDSWGSQLPAAATTHIAMSTHPKTFFATYISSYFSHLCYDKKAPAVVNGFIWANDKPGLGVDPDISLLGEPVRTFT
jgi:L-alanine-DL-glutamate epimerase-like enolase superfamily enzyme